MDSWLCGEVCEDITKTKRSIIGLYIGLYQLTYILLEPTLLPGRNQRYNTHGGNFYPGHSSYSNDGLGTEGTKGEG